MNGLKQLIIQRKIKNKQADLNYSKTILGKLVTAWRLHTKLVITLKQEIADDFDRKRLLTTYFTGLKNSKQAMQISCAKATRFYRHQIKAKLFEAIKVYTASEVAKKESDEVLIRDHNDRRIILGCFKMWRDFPGEMKRDRERQKRMDDLRRKVKEMIPDYGVPPSEETIN